MKYCNHCMAQMNEENFCPVCGKKSQAENVPVHHLLPGTILNNKFYVGEALGEGGFGITYIGRDTRLDMKVAIKEFYPNGCVTRNNTYSPQVTNSVTDERKDFFEKGKIRFLQEAQVLARFSDEPGIVGVRDFFEENNTAYIIMEYLDGINLKDYLKTKGVLSAEKTIELMMPIMMSLKKVHAQGMIHRDISPDNIMLVGNKVKLLDFGAARNVSAAENKSLSIMLKPGYAPEEQYRSKGNQGPWTDIYALCATMYKCITGITPDDATQRVFSDEVKTPSALGIKIPRYIENTIMRGMSVQQRDRFQSIEEMIRYLNSGEATVQQPQKVVAPPRPVQQMPVQPRPVQPTPIQSRPVQPTPYVQPQQPPEKKKTGLIIGIIVAVLAIICAVVAVVLVSTSDNTKPEESSTKTTETTTEEPTSENVNANNAVEYRDVNLDFSRFDANYNYLKTENITVQVPVFEEFEEYGFDEIALENDVAEIEETPTGKYMVTMGYMYSDAYEDIYVEVTVWYDNEGFTTDSIVATVILLGYYDNGYETYTQEQICYDENMEMVYGATLEDDVCTFAATNSGYSCVDNTYYDDNYEIISKEDFDAEVDRVLQPIDEILYGY